MNAISRFAAVLLLVATAVPLAAEAQGAGGAQRAAPFDAAHASTRDVESHPKTLVQLIISPQATDPQIDTFLDPHYVWLQQTETRDSMVEDPMLWFFLPSTGAKPADFQLIAEEAAHLGYHVISLMYPNKNAVGAICNPLPDADQRESCYENIRLQTLDGVRRSNFTNVNAPNSIYNRLAKLLQYLAANFPGDGWKQFLKDGAPRWSRIAVAGHSQGGGTAALIGKLHRVARVVMISSPPDGCVDPQCRAARWVAIGATPATRYYGLGHQQELPIRPIRANWKALGLDGFGTPVAPEASAPPYGCTHMLLTNLPPAPGFTNPFRLVAHLSTALDANTPRLADGTPALRDAWRYISANPHGSDIGCDSDTDTDGVEQ
jgi:hypothetical protein